MKRPYTHNGNAIVTGAGSGIGRALAIELAARGCRVVCADVNLPSADATASRIDPEHKQSCAIECDVTRREQLQMLAEQSQQWFGSETTLLINNAGVAVGGKVGEVPMEDWHWVMDVNLWGVIHGCDEFVPRFRQQGSGGIINVASMAGLVAAPSMAPYNVTKYGVVALTETLAAEFSGSRLRTSVLCPTFVRTNIVREAHIHGDDVGPLAQKLMDRIGMSPEKVARLALNGLEKNKLHVIPQLDAKAFWRIKRALPSGLTSSFGLLQRLRGHTAGS